MFAEPFFDELEKVALGKGRFAQKLKDYRLGRGARDVAAAGMKKLRRGPRPMKAMAHTLKDMSPARAIGSALITAPAVAIPAPGAHPAAMMAVNAPTYIKHYRRLGRMK